MQESDGKIDLKIPAEGKTEPPIPNYVLSNKIKDSGIQRRDRDCKIGNQDDLLSKS